jgi:hypothetical protein
MEDVELANDRFREQSGFWKPLVPTRAGTIPGELGKRNALYSEIKISGVSIVSYNLHLESRASAD